MGTVTLSWTEFLKEVKEFLQLSKKLDGNWELIKKNDTEGNTFLSCKKKVRSKILLQSTDLDEEMTDFNDQIGDNAAVASKNAQTEVLLMEYHVVYSISYEVPVLYLKVQRSDGSMLDMEQIWRIFGTNEDDINAKSREDMLTVLSQLEHPVLFKPFFAIHPCRTAQLLGQTPKSRNRVVTFISIMGPYVRLYLDNRYGLELAAKGEGDELFSVSK